MSDPNDDTLFSQDDIDKLLNAQSIEEAEESIANKGDVEDITPSEDKKDEGDIIGELSQDDIDRLLNASLYSNEPEEPASLASEFKEEFKEDDDDDLGELSQDDIEKMLNSPAADDQSNASANNYNKESTDDADAFDLISQDDIDKLMATDDMSEEPDNIADMDDLESDIEAPDNEIVESVTADSISTEEVIDPSEAWNIQDCLITQDTIDNLLNKSAQDADILDKELFNRADPLADEVFQVNLSEGETDSALENNDSDLDDLLNDAAGDMDDLLNDISQDDIDGFLKQSEDNTLDDDLALNDNDAQGAETSAAGTDDSVRNVISQDDIDALLAGTDEEDEDILADMEMDEDIKGNSVLVKNIESSLPEDDNEQVILEESVDPAATLADGTVRQLADLIDMSEEKPVKKHFLLKIIIILLLVLTLMAGCVAGVYFMFFKEKVDNLLMSSQPAGKIGETESVATEVPDMNIKESQELTPGTITLENFIAFAPERDDGITYISVDVSIEYSHSTVFDTINSRLPYYRDVIYNAINTALKSDKGNKLTESTLLEIVQDALKKALPDMKLNKVSFVNFKTG
ncbi:MAG: hypothetical protein HQK73_07140 [Desulfamplus sp.]|nr:hypothetical protein [Desulfamplus sp.]